MLHPPRQVAYFVPDIAAAARAHHDAFGSGPFFLIEHIALSRSEHRGMPRTLDHSSAYGQWGDVMVEFVQQHNPDRSAYHDMFPHGGGGQGLHHIALFVDNLAAAVERHAAAGRPLAQWCETQSGTAFAFVDARAQLGHMIELYEPSDQLTGFYAMIEAAAQGWDRRDPVRRIG
ncbi:VOC family protein [Novosphingobium sp.]|uniref:VOC family protein n=1 Tax=Novosphingobium sp. TaxID=1874826 RepID=UPI0025E204F4|nr:VOC family protein [Novosphingobium sp.]